MGRKVDLLVLHPQVSSKSAKKALNLFKQGLIKEKVETRFVDFEEVEVFLNNGEVEVSFGEFNLDEVENIFFRKVGFNKDLAFLISTLSDRKGINFIDKLYARFYDSTKLTQTFLFHMENISAPKTYFSPVYNKRKLLKAADFLGVPFVVKECNSSQGKGVSLIENKTQIEEKLKSFSGKQIILQEFIANDFEYRVLVTGSEIAVVEKKIRNKNSNEFRNNIHLGAQEEFLDINSIDKSIQELALKASSILSIQIAGVDIIEDLEGNRFVTEVNSNPGFTYDKSVSNEIPKLISFLKKWTKKR